MAYSDFSFSSAVKKFQLETEHQLDLFGNLPEAEVRDFLVELLAENVPLALAVSTEKARSELIVAPVLVEVRKLLNREISLFSGVEFTVDADRGLSGVCDFLVSRSKEQFFVKAPVVAIVEAKKDDIKSGLGQCIAEMIAAQVFNEQEGNDIPVIYGVVTTGSNWQFLQLEGQKVYVDAIEYYINNPGKILGILIHFLS